MSIPGSCDGVKTHVFMDDSSVLCGEAWLLSSYSCEFKHFPSLSLMSSHDLRT
jgi:hypothetical protein